ncbi:outer membrane biogenesis protein BamB [Polystyrenella longa]|uniref:Outer membrane biogenesis protein BamB n=2 Tax=Polystyrenella longa TaxID=2528007 RepID=A0A518CPF7_9PLAN|nr:outer membrane biogenesis protein BamB [Polystyrenella longa]
MLRQVAIMSAGLLLAIGSGITTEGADWPGFRGGMANAVATDAAYPTEWSSEKNLKWKAELPGDGNGSPIAIDGLVYVTSANEDGSERTLHCFDRNTGDELWNKVVQSEPNEETHQTNPYAGTTPAANEDCVVVWHGTPGIYCYDHSGNELWHKSYGPVKHVWGYGSSPVIYQDKVYQFYGPGENTFMVALTLSDGEEVWKKDEPGGTDDLSGKKVGSWSTPVIVKVDGKNQLVCSMPSRVLALDPQSGEELWFVGGLPSERGDLVYSSTAIGDSIGVAMGGYKGPALGFTLTGEGDATESNRIWYTPKRQPSRVSTGVIVGDYIYMANAGPGIIQCIDVKNDGEEQWKTRGTDDYWGATVMADGRIYATAKDGSTIVFAANPNEFQEIAVNTFDERSNSTPAFSNGQIFLRTNKSLFCVEQE